MSKKIEFKYFLNGVETKHEAIDWTRSMSIRPIKDTNEVHITYMSYLLDKPKPKCGLSTRHKACGQGYPAIKFNKDKLQNLLKEFEFFDNATWGNLTNETVVRSSSIQAKDYPKEVEIVKDNTKTEIPTGVKHNKAKAKISLLFKQFPKALEAITKCSEYGHNKYKDTDTDFLNFKRVEGGSATYADAGLRHRMEIGLDSESGLPHQYHTAWNALAELQLWIEENGNI